MRVAVVGGESVGERLRSAVVRLGCGGVPEAQADAEVLLAHVLGISRTTLFARLRDPFPPSAAATFEGLVLRRAAREPVFQIVGEREFWSLPFRVDRRVLSPRPETELVVETACRLAPGARRVVDAGTGSGCIAAAVAQTLPQAQVWGIDCSVDALAVAAENVARHAPGVRLVRSSWLDAVASGSVDLVVSNPPYVCAGDWADLSPEVRDWEPAAALTAGADGLDAVRLLLGSTARVLRPGGWFVCEIGGRQGPAAMGAARSWAAAFDDVRLLRDLAGHDRVLAVRRGES